MGKTKYGANQNMRENKIWGNQNIGEPKYGEQPKYGRKGVDN